MDKFNIEKYMTVKEAAVALGFHEVTVRRLARPGGKLESRVEGTTRWVKRSSVEAYLAKKSESNTAGK